MFSLLRRVQALAVSALSLPFVVDTFFLYNKSILKNNSFFEMAGSYRPSIYLE